MMSTGLPVIESPLTIERSEDSIAETRTKIVATDEITIKEGKILVSTETGIDLSEIEIATEIGTETEEKIETETVIVTEIVMTIGTEIVIGIEIGIKIVDAPTELKDAAIATAMIEIEEIVTEMKVDDDLRDGPIIMVDDQETEEDFKNEDLAEAPTFKIF